MCSPTRHSSRGSRSTAAAPHSRSSTSTASSSTSVTSPSKCTRLDNCRRRQRKQCVIGERWVLLKRTGVTVATAEHERAAPATATAEEKADAGRRRRRTPWAHARV